MEIMRPSENIPNVTNIKYPVYLQPKLVGTRAVYMPGIGLIDPLTEHKLDNIKSDKLNRTDEYVLDIIITKKKLYVFDCIPVKDWNNKDCKITYEKRLKTLRELINGVIADYTNIMDIPTSRVINPNQLKELYSFYLTKDLKGVILRSIDGLYKWKPLLTEDQEMMKLETISREKD